jgi:hypothetical protein
VKGKRKLDKTRADFRQTASQHNGGSMSDVMVGQDVAFYPKDGSRPLAAKVVSQAPNGWWDIEVDNTSVEDGTPHRRFETRSRPVGAFDDDKRGLFSANVRMVHGPGPYQFEPGLAYG